MANFNQFGALLLKAVLVPLVCLPELSYARAQNDGDAESLTVLDAHQVSGLIMSQVSPEYPALARLNFIQGQVRVELIVSASGAISRAHVLKGNPLLAAAVLSVIPQWRYHPLVTDGISKSFITVVSVNFALHFKDREAVPPDAESDFNRQVKPPEVLTGPAMSPSSNPTVHLRLLINGQGKVIDWEILYGSPSQLEAARRTIARWSFRPALWGTLPVPWYLDVKVPVNKVSAELNSLARSGF